ncbi:hypothetical protein KKC1_20200, partial [Calderihabitans maritimus]
MRLAAE